MSEEKYNFDETIALYFQDFESPETGSAVRDGQYIITDAEKHAEYVNEQHRLAKIRESEKREWADFHDLVLNQ